jgi:[acyl-carrier-protein] S-malonyltransferase
MKPAATRFRPLLEQAAEHWHPAAAGAVTSNFSGGFHQPERASIVDLLARQICAPVRWLDNMRTIDAHTDRVVELGPGKPLRALFASIDVEVTPVTTLAVAAEALSA